MISVPCIFHPAYLALIFQIGSAIHGDYGLRRRERGEALAGQLHVARRQRCAGIRCSYEFVGQQLWRKLTKLGQGSIARPAALATRLVAPGEGGSGGVRRSVGKLGVHMLVCIYLNCRAVHSGMGRTHMTFAP